VFPNRGKSEVDVYASIAVCEYFQSVLSARGAGSRQHMNGFKLTSLLVILLAVIGNEVAGWLLLRQDGGDAPYGAFFPHWLVGGPRNERVWAGCRWPPGCSCGEFYVWRQVRKGQARDQDPQLDQPKNFDLSAGSGVRPDSPLVASGWAAFGENDVEPVAVSWIAVRHFLGAPS